jgi:RNA polymerase sigma factor (sigma-70 family)
MIEDRELLREYVENRSESAFTRLVNDHLNLVYSAALRETNGDSQLAEDLVQAVFTELARKSSALLRHPSLSGWLYTTVRHMAANQRRADQRRRQREEEASSMNELHSEGAPDRAWKQLRPVLDDVLHALKEEDRLVVVLRFLENRSLREIGTALGLQENAARMRVDRALEKMRVLLGRRGITSTVSGLTAAMALGVVTPAPAALTTVIAGTAVAGGTVAASGSLTLIKLMTLTKASLIGALVVAGITIPAWQQKRLEQVRAQNAQLLARAAEVTREKTNAANSNGETEPARKPEAEASELARLKQWQAQTEPELLRLRGMAGVARRANAEAEALRSQLARQASAPGATPVAGAMAEAMKLAMDQQVEGKLSRLKTSLNLTPEQESSAREILKKQAQAMSAGMQQAFSGKFDKEEIARLGKEAGNTEEQLKALLTPDQKASYSNYQQEEAAYNARLMANNELIGLQATVGLTQDQMDRAFAALYEANFNQTSGSTKPPAGNQAEIMQWTLDQKAKVLQPILTQTQMESYQQQQAIQVKLAKDILGKMQGTTNPN